MKWTPNLKRYLLDDDFGFPSFIFPIHNGDKGSDLLHKIESKD